MKKNLVADRIAAALELLSIEAENEQGKTLPYFYTLAEDLYRMEAAIGGGSLSAIGDRVKDACVELRLALEVCYDD